MVNIPSDTPLVKTTRLVFKFLAILLHQAPELWDIRRAPPSLMNIEILTVSYELEK